MALQSTPPISLSDIKTEFPSGGNNLTDYYRSPGGVVPDSGPNSGVPTSGNIQITDLLGASNFTEKLVNHSLSAGDSNPYGAATNSVTFQTDGLLVLTATPGGSVTPAVSDEWGSPTSAGIGSSYWVMKDSATGSSFPGPVSDGTWAQITSDLTWSRTVVATGGGTVSAGGSFVMHLALSSGGPDVASMTINWYVQAG